jgi:hypothetical protein
MAYRYRDGAELISTGINHGAGRDGWSKPRPDHFTAGKEFG